MYILLGLLYWPVWLGLEHGLGVHPLLAILTGFVVAMGSCLVLWRIEFGKWWFR
jgi:hypothetical protein